MYTNVNQIVGQRYLIILQQHHIFAQELFAREYIRYVREGHPTFCILNTNKTIFNSNPKRQYVLGCKIIKQETHTLLCEEEDTKIFFL